MKTRMLIGCLLSATMVAFGEATTCVWSGSDGGVWTDSANWSGGRAPQSAEDIADFGSFLGTAGFSTAVETWLGGLKSSGGHAVINLNGGTFNIGGPVQDCYFAGEFANSTIVKYGPNRQTFAGVQRQALWRVLGGTMAFDLELRPLVHYTFDDAGDIGADSGALGKRLDGIVNVTYFNDATRGGCARFDSTLGALYASDAAGLPGGNSPFTISLWVRNVGQFTFWTFTSWGSADNSVGYGKLNRFCLRQAEVRHTFNNGDSDIPLAGTGFSFGGEWNHIAVTFDGSSRKLYVNGAFAADMTATTANVLTAGTVFCIGCFTLDGTVANISNGFGGDMDDVMVFGAALGADDIRRVYDGTKISGEKIPANANIVVGMGAAIEFEKGEQTIGGIEGAGDIVLDDASVTVAPAANASATVGRLLGNGTLVKTGAGTLKVGRAAECGGTLDLEAGNVSIQGGGISLEDERLVAYWKFDDRQNPGKDSGPHNMTLAPSGDNTWDDHFTVGGMSVYNSSAENGTLHFADSESKEFLPGNTFTLAMWLKPEGSSQYKTILRWGTDDGYNKLNWLKFNAFNVLSHQHKSGVDLNHTIGNDVFYGPVAPRGWHHLAITADSSCRKMYLDGELIEEINITANGSGANGKNADKTDITLGGFKGYYDEVAIFSAALSAAEIRQVAAGIGSSGVLSVVQQQGTSLVLEGGELNVGDAELYGDLSGAGTLSVTGRVAVGSSASFALGGLKLAEGVALVVDADSPAIAATNQVALPAHLNVEVNLAEGAREAVVDLLSCQAGFAGSTDGWTGVVKVDGLPKPKLKVSFAKNGTLVSAKVSPLGFIMVVR